MKNLSLKARLTLIISLIISLLIVSLTLINFKNVNSKIIIPITPLENVQMAQTQISIQPSIGPNSPVSPPNLELDPDSPDPVYATKIQLLNKDFQNYTYIWMLGLLVISIGLIYLAISISIRPIEDLIKNVKAINENNLGERVDLPRSRDEIQVLSLEFNRMLDRLEDSFSYQKSFSANAAHELRTPLSIMKLNAQLLSLDLDPDLEAYGDYAQVASQSIDQLIKIVDDLMSLSNQDLKALDTISPRELIEELVEEVEVFLNEKNIRLELYMDESHRIQGDRGLVYRMFYNLISNAIKYSRPQSRICISSRLEGPDLLIFINDRGLGIAPADLPFIFQPFFRVDRSRSKDLGGSGLGLALVEKIVQGHGWQISLKSKLGWGSSFILRIKK